MKTKLRALTLIGLILLLLPIVYIPVKFFTIIFILLGLWTIYLAWRIAIQYRSTVRRHQEPLVSFEQPLTPLEQ